MATWESVIRTRTELSESERGHLSILIQEWSLPADLSFSDLVLFVRTWDAAGWFVAAHVRPSTAPTSLTDDPLGAFLPRSQALTLERAYQSAKPARGGSGRSVRLGSATLPEPIEAIPVPYQGSVVAVIARYSQIDQRRLGELERQYLNAGDILFGMIGRGEFPLAAPPTLGGDAPRVGDGFIRLGADGSIQYASPNARSALRHLGVPDPAPGSALADELVLANRRHEAPDAERLRLAAGEAAGDTEFASPTAVLTLRSLPLRDATGPVGAVVLVRDVSDVRRQERALLSKDATIREIHHRVKNNLQTVGALLRLQARRMPVGEGRSALLDAVTRVGTIALVHDSLSRSPGEDVDFDEISRRVLVMARDAAAALDTDAPRVVTVGSFGVLPSAVATPLAMAFAEVLLNAMEHSRASLVEVTAQRDDHQLLLTVADDGVGFDPRAVEGLGLQIVGTLVSEQLDGTLTIDSAPRIEQTPQPMVTVVTIACGI